MTSPLGAPLLGELALPRKEVADPVDCLDGYIVPPPQTTDELAVVDRQAAKRRLRNSKLRQGVQDLSKKLVLERHGSSIGGTHPTVKGNASPLPLRRVVWNQSQMLDAKVLTAEIDRLIKEQQKSRRAVCRAANVNDTYIRDLAKGKSFNPKTDHLDRVARQLGKTAGYFLAVARKSPPATPGERLHAIRDALGVSPEEMDTKLRLRPGSWALYEQGGAEVPLSLAAAIEQSLSSELGITVAFLAHGHLEGLSESFLAYLAAYYPTFLSGSP